MSFTVQDFNDLVRLLSDHPEWRPELRRLVLTDELLALPDLVRDLVDAQRRAEARFGNVEVRLIGVEERQLRLEERQQRLEVRQGALEERLTALEERLTALEKRVAKIEVRLAEIDLRLTRVETQLEANTRELQRLSGEFGNFKGKHLEAALSTHPAQVLGLAFKAVRGIGRAGIPDAVESAVSKDEFRELLRLDALVVAQPREQPEVGDVWLAIEVSDAVYANDVARAHRRAAILRSAGVRAVPLVAGDSLRADGAFAAREGKVITLIDQEFDLVPETLTAHLSA